MQISDLEQYLNKSEGEHLVYTGTFDPVHNGHFSVINEATKKGDNPLILNPCDRNPDKTQTRSKLSLRLHWLSLALSEMELGAEVALLDDPRFRTKWGSLDQFMKDNAERVFKVIGPDKEVEDGISFRRLGDDRVPGLSSSSLKTSLNSGEFEKAKLQMPASVVEDIKTRAFKFKNT